MFVGIEDYEYEKPQQVIINAWLDVAINTTNLKADNIEDVYNYVSLKQDIERITSSGHIGLIENLAEQIADSALTNEMVLSCRVSVQKPEVFKELESVGVEITKERLSS